MRFRISADRVEQAGFTIESWTYDEASRTLDITLTDSGTLPEPDRTELEALVSPAEADMLIDRWLMSLGKQIFSRVIHIGD
jgi:YD repeat-containing protein